MVTFQGLAAEYFRQHIMDKRSYTTVLRLFRKHFASWTEHKTYFEIRAWHQSLHKTPSEANKALGFLRAMYNWGKKTGDATGKRALWEGENPAAGAGHHKEYSREVTFTDAQLRRFFTYLDFHYKKLAVYLTVMICSACRGGEAREMRWDYVDYENCCWYKPNTKNGRSQRLPLPKQAIDAIKSMEATRRPCSPYIFQGIYGDRPWSRAQAEKAWRKAAFDMGLTMKDRHGKIQAAIRLHDFRRTVASRVYKHTKDLQLVKAILNHFDGSATAVYVRLNYDYIAQELQANADRFWSLKQEVTYDDSRTLQCAAGPVAGLDSAVADAGSLHHGRPDGPADLL